MSHQDHKFSFSIKSRKSRAKGALPVDLSFRAFLYDDSRYLRSETFDTRKQADSWARAQIAHMEQGIDSGASAKGSALKFDNLVKLYLADDSQGGVPQIHGLVFPHPESPTDIFSIRKPWDRLKKAAGLDAPRGHPVYFRLHDLRHTTATQLIAGGATLAQAGHVLGHKSVQSTARYAHLLKAKKQALVDALLNGRGAGGKGSSDGN